MDLFEKILRLCQKEGAEFFELHIDILDLDLIKNQLLLVKKVFKFKPISINISRDKFSNANIIELIKFNSHNSVSQAWHGNQFSLGLTHIAVTVENINYFFEYIKSVYGDFGTTICKSDDGNVKMAYVKGPEGLLIELVEELK